VIAGAFAVPPSPDVAAAFESALQRLARAGLGVEREVRLPELEQAPRTSGPIIGAEAALAWSREMAGDRAQFGDEVVGYLDKGAKVLAVRYLQAQLDRARLAAAIDALLRAVDVLLLPATASAATPASAPGPQLAFLALTVPFSLSGHPVLSVPMGEAGGLPVGMQIVGRAGREDVLLRVGAAFEDAA
jgi:aspartyl-tRNA(Asn)/glutamyl-tRNA(Gln) amidotransferase subunit A